MAGSLFTSAQFDTDGRQLVLSDNILHVSSYSTVGEFWDTAGTNQQSWAREIYIPNDTFDSSSMLVDRWSLVDTSSSVGEAVVQQTGNSVQFSLLASEGRLGYSSENKWKLSGDFEIRLYIDWSFYYNEYRGISSTYFKIGVDDKNAVRLTFTFDGASKYQFRSEKIVGRDPKFFEWKKNGEHLSFSQISGPKGYEYFKITRQSGVVSTYVFDGEVDVQLGTGVADAAFSSDVYVEFGVENKEYNYYKSSFTKFFVVSGQVTPEVVFSSSLRGQQVGFPQKSILVVDDFSLSIIDEPTSKLWMRFLISEDNALSSGSIRLSASHGIIYCAFGDGVTALDFPNDRILKYKSGVVYLADENIAMRNSGVLFREYITSIGNFLDNNSHDVVSARIAGQDYVAFTHDLGVSVFRPLASGVSNSTDGNIPGNIVKISQRGSLYWSGYDQTNNSGDISYFSNIAALTVSGTESFSRTGYYGSDSLFEVFGNNIRALDVVAAGDLDLLAVGSTEGITFISPAAGAVSFGVSAPADNPFLDPSFEDHIGVYWKMFYTGFHTPIDLSFSDGISPSGTKGLKIRYLDSGSNRVWQEDTLLGVYQDVDLTGVERVYYDLHISPTSGANEHNNLWDFEIVVGDVVVKSYTDISGPFTKFNDSVDVVSFSGVHRFYFRCRMIKDHSAGNTSQRFAVVDNIRTSVGDPNYRILPPGNANVLEVLLQYDSSGHKIYFSTQEGYGAIDLDDRSLDYFIPVFVYGPDDADILSGDFSRIANEG